MLACHIGIADTDFGKWEVYLWPLRDSKKQKMLRKSHTDEKLRSKGQTTKLLISIGFLAINIFGPSMIIDPILDVI